MGCVLLARLGLLSQRLPRVWSVTSWPAWPEGQPAGSLWTHRGLGPGHCWRPRGRGGFGPTSLRGDEPAGSCGAAEHRARAAVKLGTLGPAANAAGPRAESSSPPAAPCGPSAPASQRRVTAAAFQGGGDSESGKAGPPSCDRAGTRTQVYAALTPTSLFPQPEPLRGDTSHRCPGDCGDVGGQRAGRAQLQGLVWQLGTQGRGAWHSGAAPGPHAGCRPALLHVPSSAGQTSAPPRSVRGHGHGLTPGAQVRIGAIADRKSNFQKLAPFHLMGTARWRATRGPGRGARESCDGNTDEKPENGPGPGGAAPAALPR